MSKRKLSVSELEKLQRKLAKYKKKVEDNLVLLEEDDDSSESESVESTVDDVVVVDKENAVPSCDEVELEGATPAAILEVSKQSSLNVWLGTANCKEVKGSYELPEEIAEIWSELIEAGLDKKCKSDLLKKFPRKGNCKLQTPVLNEVMSSLMNKTAKTRDKYLAENQDLVGLSLINLGQAIGSFNEEAEDSEMKTQILGLLCDASQLLCEHMHQLTKTRRIYIYPGVEDKYKKLLEDSKADSTLFGEDLVSRIKAANAAEKLSQSMKVAPRQPLTGRNLNWKRPSPMSSKGQTGTAQRSSFLKGQRDQARPPFKGQPRPPFNGQPRPGPSGSQQQQRK